MVFKKLGILALVIPYGFGILAQLAIAEDQLSAGIGYMIGAILIYFLGKYLNRNYKIVEKGPKSILDKIDAKHSFLYIRMEYWSLIWITVGILVIINNDYAFDKMIQLLGFILLIIALLALFRMYQRFGYKYDSYQQIVESDSKESKQTNSKSANNNTKKSISTIKNTTVRIKDFSPSDHDRFKPS